MSRCAYIYTYIISLYSYIYIFIYIFIYIHIYIYILTFTLDFQIWNSVSNVYKYVCLYRFFAFKFMNEQLSMEPFS